MKEYVNYVCNNVDEVANATENLDKASMLPLKIDDGGVLKDVNNYKGIYNISKGKFCTAVINHYNLVQHKEYFDSFARAMDRLNLKYQMKITQVGNRAFADVEFKGQNLKFDKLNEEFATGFRLINSYDKTTGIFIAPRFTRLACTNGMVVTTMQKTVSIKHHSKIVKEISGLIERKLHEVINQADHLKSWVSSSMKDSKEWKACCGIIEKLFSQIKHREEVLKRLGIAIVEVENKKTKKKAIQYVWNDTTQKKAKFTRWEIYNAITNYLTFGEQMTPHVESLFQAKASKILTTPLEKMPLVEVKI